MFRRWSWRGKSIEATDPEDCSVGIGRVGVLKEALTLREFAEKVKEGMRLPAVRLYGDPERVIRRAADVGRFREKCCEGRSGSWSPGAGNGGSELSYGN